MTYHFHVYDDDDGYWAESVELEGCVTQGDTLRELTKNMHEALNGYLASVSGRNIAFPLPLKQLDNDVSLVKIPVNADIAFRVQLRNYRLRNNLTQADMQERLGLRSRNSYVKLEHEGNPTMRTAGNLKKAFPDFPIAECF